MIAGWFAAGGMLIISDWAAVFFEKYRWRWLTKTGAMLCLIAAYTLSGGWQTSSWFGMGLIFSLGGDTFLLLPPRYFLAGLAAFFLAQLSYILAFHHPPAPLWINHLLSAGVLLIVALVAFRRVLAVLPAESRAKRLQWAILLYILAISAMVYSALATLWNPAWPLSAAWLAVAGAIFFYFSDWTLANQRFIRTTRSGRLIVMITYHLAQVLLVAAFLLRK